MALGGDDVTSFVNVPGSSVLDHQYRSLTPHSKPHLKIYLVSRPSFCMYMCLRVVWMRQFIKCVYS